MMFIKSFKCVGPCLPVWYFPFWSSSNSIWHKYFYHGNILKGVAVNISCYFRSLSVLSRWICWHLSLLPFGSVIFWSFLVYKKYMHDIGFMQLHKHGHPFTDFKVKSRSVSETKYQCFSCLLLKDSILIQCPIEKRREVSEGVNTRLKINKSKNRQNEKEEKRNNRSSMV